MKEEPKRKRFESILIYDDKDKLCTLISKNEEGLVRYLVNHPNTKIVSSVSRYFERLVENARREKDGK